MSAEWRVNRRHYSPEAIAARVKSRADAMDAARALVQDHRDPCVRCSVRPEHHDEHGCSRFTVGRLRA